MQLSTSVAVAGSGRSGTGAPGGATCAPPGDPQPQGTIYSVKRFIGRHFCWWPTPGRPSPNRHPERVRELTGELQQVLARLVAAGDGQRGESTGEALSGPTAGSAEDVIDAEFDRS